MGLRGFNSIAGVGKCSPAFWGVFVILFLYTGGIAVILKKYYKFEETQRTLNSYSFHPSEIKYGSNFPKFMVSGLISGFVIGAVGAGGGMFLTPILVSSGVNQRAASAISGLIIVYSSGTSIILSLITQTI